MLGRIVGLSLLLWSAVGFHLATARPLSLLILDGGHGDEGQLDAGYAERLRAANIQVAHARMDEPLAAPFFQKFDVFVLGCMPIDNAENELFAWRSTAFRSNMDRLVAAVKDGAGLLVYADLIDGGAWKLARWNNEMRPFGAALGEGSIRDSSHQFAHFGGGNGESWYGWTQNVAKHPVTEGIRHIAYPTGSGRWDGCYLAPPLKLDSSWTPLVRAGKSAQVGFMEDRKWLDDAPASEDLVWSAVRTLGKGRLAVVSMPPIFSHRLGYHKNMGAQGYYGEACVGVLDGIILETGDGTTPSDTGKFLLNLYRWLGANPLAENASRYVPGDPVEREPGPFAGVKNMMETPVDWDRVKPLRSWAHITVPEAGGDLDDPEIKGEIRFFKALVGAHTSLSDGAGTVAEYARAARTAGYSVVAFTESFEHLTREKWDRLVEACRTNSSDDLVLLPGFDIVDFAGNHYLVINPTLFPRPSWLTADGKRLRQVQLINALSIGNCLMVAHRPGAGPLPVERLKFFSGLSVATYRGGNLVDDGRPAYAWHVANASGPIPIVVHEVFSPAEVDTVAKTGLQQVLPADTVRHAADYFRSGMNHYFTFPSRHWISEGPIVEQFVISHPGAGAGTWNQFRLWIKVTAETPLSEVILYDGFTPVRRWKPAGKILETTANFQHDQQRHLYLVARDQQGREAITSSIRTILPRHAFRCPDRQNWLGDVGAQYTGTKLSDHLDIVMPVEGTEEGNGLLPNSPGHCLAVKVSFPFVSRELVVTDIALDEKYTTATWVDIAMDAKPSFPSEPTTVYEGRFRRWGFTGHSPTNPYPTVAEFDLRLKRAVTPRDPAGLFPALGTRRDKTPFEATQFDLAAGELGAGFIPLTDGFQVSKGWFGLKGPTTNSVAAGTRFFARLLLTSGHEGWRTAFETRFHEQPDAWANAVGLARPAPYQLELQRGTLQRIAFLAEMIAQDGLIAGDVKVAAAIPYPLPLQIDGVNPRWPAGIWRPSHGIRHVGVFEGKCWPAIDTGKAGPFIAGNLITADQPELFVSVIQWTAARLQLEVHNPTDGPLTARLRTPLEIPGHLPLDRTITIPGGASLVVETPDKP